MEKTIKIHAYPEGTKNNAMHGGSVLEQSRALELATKDAQIEEEKSRSLEYLKTIVQLRENLKHEQEKTAEMVNKIAEQAAKIKDQTSLESDEIARKDTLYEEEKLKTLGQVKIIEQLQENLKQEHAKTAGLEGIIAEQEVKAKESAELAAKVKDLTETLSRITAIAAGKAG